MSTAEPTLVKLLCPAPKTERGFGQHLNTSSRDGDKLIYGSGWSVFWRSLEDPTVGASFTGHRADCKAAAFSPNGLWVASGDVHGQLKTWEWKNGKTKLDTGVLTKINDVAWAEDNKKVVAVGVGSPNFGKAVTFDTGNTVGEVTNHSKEVLSVAVSPGRPQRVITCGEDLTVNWSEAFPVKFKESHKSKHSRYPNCVRFSPDGAYWCTVGSDSKILVGDGKTGEIKKELGDKKTGHKGAAIYNFSWAPDSKRILTCSADKTAVIWNVESGAVEVTFEFNAKSKSFKDMLVSSFWHKGKDKEYIGVLTLGAEFLMLDPSKPEGPVGRIQGLRSIPVVCKADRVGGKFYVGGQAGDITVYDIKTHESQWINGEGHGEKVIAGLAVTDSELVSIGWDNKVFFSDKKTLAYGDSIALGSQPSAVCTANRDHSMCFVTLRKGKIVVIKDKAVVSELEVSYEPQGIDISADDSELTVSSKQKTIYRYTLEGTKLVEKAQIKDSPKSSTYVTYHPSDPKCCIVQNAQNQTLVIKDGEIKNSAGWEYHLAALKTGAWCPSGKRFATGGMDETVLIWTDFETYSSSARSKIEGFFQGVTALDWLDDETLVVCCYDMSIKIYKV